MYDVFRDNAFDRAHGMTQVSDHGLIRSLLLDGQLKIFAALKTPLHKVC